MDNHQGICKLLESGASAEDAVVAVEVLHDEGLNETEFDYGVAVLAGGTGRFSIDDAKHAAGAAKAVTQLMIDRNR